MNTVTVNGVQEKDPLSMSYRDLVLKREPTRHQTLTGQEKRPDLIANVQYQSPGFWWFILGVNGIIDPYDVPDEFMLTIPDMLDYYDWFRDQKEQKED
jgi:hypothetical protein